MIDWGLKPDFIIEVKHETATGIKNSRCVIKDYKYNCFDLELHENGDWEIIGLFLDEKSLNWDCERLGILTDNSIKNFIEWAKTENGSKIVEFSAVSKNINLFEGIKKLFTTTKQK